MHCILHFVFFFEILLRFSTGVACAPCMKNHNSENHFDSRNIIVFYGCDPSQPGGVHMGAWDRPQQQAAIYKALAKGWGPRRCYGSGIVRIVTQIFFWCSLSVENVEFFRRFLREYLIGIWVRVCS